MCEHGEKKKKEAKVKGGNGSAFECCRDDSAASLKCNCATCNSRREVFVLCILSGASVTSAFQSPRRKTSRIYRKKSQFVKANLECFVIGSFCGASSNPETITHPQQPEIAPRTNSIQSEQIAIHRRVRGERSSSSQNISLFA